MTDALDPPWTLAARERRAWKRELQQRQGGRCAYCGRSLKLSDGTLDHVMPLKVGGLDVFENLLFVCEPCNHGKASDLPSLDFHEAIRLRIHGGRRAA